MEMTDEERKLRLEFYQLEKYYRPLFDLYTENQSEYSEYQGASTIDGYLSYKPDVLILGYNPAHGKYHDWNKNGAHLVYTGERPLGIFEWGNANKNGEWYEMSKPKKHPYLKDILEFLFKLAELRNWEKRESANKRPSWKNHAEKAIMIMNLYPIGTKNGKTLRNLFTKTIAKNAVPYDSIFENEWALRKHLLYKLHQFVDKYVKPKAILCLGKSTISDYCWGGENFSQSNYDGVFVGKNYKNVVGVSRAGTWTSRAKNAAYLINDILG